MKKREEIDEKYKWDISGYAKSLDACEEELKKASSRFFEISKFENQLNNEENIYACLMLSSNISEQLEKLYVYSALKVRENAKDSKAVELNEKVGSACVNYSTISSFIDVEIGEHNEEFLTDLMNNKNYPQFRTYFKSILRHKKYLLSKKEEKLLSQMGEFTGGFSDIFDMFDNADVKFEDAKDSKGEKHTLTHATYSLLVESQDRELRKNAFKNINKAYGEYNNTIATTYNYNTKNDVVSARVRKYDSARQAALSGGNIPEEVYDNLISVVNEYLPVLHKYTALRKRVLGVDELKMYDIYVPLVQLPKKDIPYEEALKMMQEGLAPLGEEYLAQVDRGTKEGWIDVYENQGKTSGAYSFGSYSSMPYILLNYTDTLKDVFTIVHEMGHSMHSYYTRKTQPYTYGDHSIFTAEVASTVNESLLMQHLLATETDPEMR